MDRGQERARIMSIVLFRRGGSEPVPIPWALCEDCREPVEDDAAHDGGAPGTVLCRDCCSGRFGQLNAYACCEQGTP